MGLVSLLDSNELHTISSMYFKTFVVVMPGYNMILTDFVRTGIHWFAYHSNGNGQLALLVTS